MLGLTHILVRVVLSASAAFTIGLLSYEGVTGWLWQVAFPETLPAVRAARGAVQSFAHGLGLPFVYFAAPLVFIAGYVVVVNFWLKGAPRAWATHAIVGAASWGALGVLLVTSLLAEPPFADATLGARAWIAAGGFTLYLAVIGASAGLLCRLLAGETRQAAPAGASVDLNRPL